MKVNYRFIFLVSVVLFIVTTSACSSPTSTSVPISLLLGDWYNESEIIDFTFEENGSFRWVDEDVTGLYNILNDNTLEITTNDDVTESYGWAGNKNIRSGQWFVNKEYLYINGNTYSKNKSGKSETNDTGSTGSTQELKIENISAGLISDGTIWVKQRIDSSVFYSCFDTTGKKLFSLDPDSVPSTEFVNGVAVVDMNCLIDKTGKTIWSLEENGKSEGERLFGVGNVESVEFANLSYNRVYYFWGGVFVSYSIETFEWSGTKTGVIDCNGDWQLEPVEITAGSFYGGPFYDLYIEDTWGCYNIFNGEFAVGGHIGEESNAEQIEQWTRQYYFDLDGGLVYNQEQNGFCDAEGTKVIDLSRYNLRETPYFTDGYCFLHIENDQGSAYTTIIDTSGKEMFQPIKEFDHGDIRQGLFRVLNEDGTATFLDEQMNEIIQNVELVYNYCDFSSDGVVLVKDDQGFYLLDLNGDRIDLKG